AFLARTDWLPTDGQTVAVRLNYQNFRVTNVPENGFNAPAVTGQALSNQGLATVKNLSLAIHWSALLSPGLTNEARFQLAVTRENETANTFGPQVRIGSRNTGVSFGGSELFPRTLDEDRWQWADSLSINHSRH